MQERYERRSNRDRTEATRAALIEAGRALFVARGYAETGTPDIVAAAGVTRGALYHHFADKQALFRAVVEGEAEAVARAVDASTGSSAGVKDALLRGGDAFLAAMRLEGRTRLLLLDGPAVLGRAEMDAIDMRHGGRTLREGLAAGIAAGEVPDVPVEALAALLSAMFDRAALEIAGGGSEGDQRKAVSAVVEGLVR